MSQKSSKQAVDSKKVNLEKDIFEITSSQQTDQGSDFAPFDEELSTWWNENEQKPKVTNNTTKRTDKTIKALDKMTLN